MMKISPSRVAAALLCTAACAAFAAATPEEAAKLKTTFTPVGAERAGNAAGTIPAWTGSIVKPPAGSSGTFPDLFPQEKPVLEITAANAAQHKDKLSEGTLALLAKFPTYKVQVYPTHRTAVYQPFIYERTAQNALKTTLSADGTYVENYLGGVAFPIPKNGNEVILNHFFRPRPCAHEAGFNNVVISSNGAYSVAASGKVWGQFPYQCAEQKPNPDHVYALTRQLTEGPSYKAGEALLITDKIGPAASSRAAWQYLVGQRRVRRAPNVGYDTPDFIASGTNYFDEVGGFLAPIDRFEWKLVGKQEMYVPYNNHRLLGSKVGEAIIKDHVNPNLMRWELHRVWIVEATVAPGKRHVVPKRRLYIDEDNWTVMLVDGYDASGKLWRTSQVPNAFLPDGSGFTQDSVFVYNLQASTMSAVLGYFGGYYKSVPTKPDEFYGPDAVASDAQR